MHGFLAIPLRGIEGRGADVDEEMRLAQRRGDARFARMVARSVPDLGPHLFRRHWTVRTEGPGMRSTMSTGLAYPEESDGFSHCSWTRATMGCSSRCTTSWSEFKGYESEGYEPLVTYEPNTRTEPLLRPRRKRHHGNPLFLMNPPRLPSAPRP